MEQEDGCCNVQRKSCLLAIFNSYLFIIKLEYYKFYANWFVTDNNLILITSTKNIEAELLKLSQYVFTYFFCHSHT
jgi:hypothetical protein